MPKPWPALDKRHAEAMAALADRHRADEERHAAFGALIAGMETMIERTAPKGTAD